jgi:hypothetical protein
MTVATDLRAGAGWAGATTGLEGIVAGVAMSLACVEFRMGSAAGGVAGEAGSVSGVVSVGADESAAVLLIGAGSAAGGIAAGWDWSFGGPAGLSGDRPKVSGVGLVWDIGIEVERELAREAWRSRCDMSIAAAPGLPFAFVSPRVCAASTRGEDDAGWLTVSGCNSSGSVRLAGRF